jgi:hypothetical protein
MSCDRRVRSRSPGLSGPTPKPTAGAAGVTGAASGDQRRSRSGVHRRLNPKAYPPRHRSLRTLKPPTHQELVAVRGQLEGIFGGVGFVEHRHLFLLRDVDRLSAVGEQLVGAVQRSVGRRILGVVFGLAVPPDVFMCVVTEHREDVLPCVHARHPAGRHADGQIETRGDSTAPACPESPPGRRRRAAARGWGYSLGRTTDVCAQRPTVTKRDGDRCRCGRGVRGGLAARRTCPLII